MSGRPLPTPTGREPCRKDPDRWHPEPGNPRLATQAKQECLGCPLFDACLDYALHVSVQGIWGGTTEAERKTIRRQRGIVAEPVVPTDAELLAAEMQRMARAGTPPIELSRHFRVSKRHVTRVLSAGRAAQELERVS